MLPLKQNRLATLSSVKLTALLLFAAMVCTGVQAQTFQVLHNFVGTRDGANPAGGLTIDRAGNLYGTALAGGYQGSGCADFWGGTGCGTVYELSRAGSGWILNTLYAFQGGNDSGNPGYPVIFGQDGALYGVSGAGTGCGSGGICGTAFRLTPPPARCVAFPCAWRETVLHQFTGTPDGSGPGSPLVTDTAGNLYGTTYAGGVGSVGTVYELSHSGGNWTENVIYSFQSSQGLGMAYPSAQIAIDPTGNLYGTTNCNDNLGCFYGAVWELQRTQSGWTLNPLFQFNGNNGYSPMGVIRDSAGNLYGTTQGDGEGHESAAVYELSPSSGWAYNQLYDFGGFGEADTFYLVMDAQGNLYGADYITGFGYIYKLTRNPNGWSFSTVHTFTSADGEFPNGTMVLDSNGNLYGTTIKGGSYGFGTIWEISNP